MDWLAEKARSAVDAVFGNTSVGAQSRSDTATQTEQAYSAAQRAAVVSNSTMAPIDVNPQAAGGVEQGLINSMLGVDELLHIFDLLPPEDLLTRVALVCRRW